MHFCEDIDQKLETLLAQKNLVIPHRSGSASTAGAWSIVNATAPPPGLWQPDYEIDDSTIDPWDEPPEVFYTKPPVMLRSFQGGAYSPLHHLH